MTGRQILLAVLAVLAALVGEPVTSGQIFLVTLGRIFLKIRDRVKSQNLEGNQNPRLDLTST